MFTDNYNKRSLHEHGFSLSLREVLSDMKFSTKSKFTLAAVATAALVACGGGGGGSNGGGVTPPSASENITVSGVAAKGILVKGQVYAYKISDLTTPIAGPAETDVNGNYTLEVNSDEPLVIKIKVVQGITKYYDENNIVDGEYDYIEAPEDLELSTFVPQAVNGAVTASINPFTTAAVKYVEQAIADGKPVTQEVFNAAKDIAKAAAHGVDPFEAKPKILAEIKDATADDLKLMHALSGFAKQSENCPKKDEDESLAACQMRLLEEASKEGSVEKLLSYVEQQVEAGNTALQKLVEEGLDIGEFAQSKVDFEEFKKEVLSSPAIPKETIQQFAEKFISYLKSDSSLLKIYDENISKNYEYLLNKSTYEVLEYVYSFLNDCEVAQDGTISCSGNVWNAMSSNTAERVTTGTDKLSVETVLNNNEITVSISGKAGNSEIQSLTLAFSNEKLAGKKWHTIADEASKIAMNSTMVVKNGSTNVAINYDVELEAGENNIVYVDGQASLTSSNGDMFKGPLEADVLISDAGQVLKFEIERMQFASEKGQLGNQPASFALKPATYYKPANVSGSGFDQFNIDGSISFGSVISGLEINRTAADALTAKVGLGGVVANLTASANGSGDYCIQLDKNFCFETMNMESASGRFTATVNLNSGTGTVSEGGALVGQISGGKVQLDGTELSFR